jgi:hypothetical protein
MQTTKITAKEIKALPEGALKETLTLRLGYEKTKTKTEELVRLFNSIGYLLPAWKKEQGQLPKLVTLAFFANKALCEEGKGVLTQSSNAAREIVLAETKSAKGIKQLMGEFALAEQDFEVSSDYWFRIEDISEDGTCKFSDGEEGWGETEERLSFAEAFKKIIVAGENGRY